MRRYWIHALAAIILLSFSARGAGAVEVRVSPTKRTEWDGSVRLVQSVAFSNERANYTLTYDRTQRLGKPQEVTSRLWAWKTKLVTLGMSDPTQANWYFQGFFNWHFDDESLYNRPAKMRLIRSSGPDGMIEYAWDTPKANVTIRFALTRGNDKLLMFGHYKPKGPMKESFLKLSCYPTGFAEPHNRSVSTSLRTVSAPALVKMDCAKERWALYEDTTPGRPGAGPAGLVIGTPSAFREVVVQVGNYNIATLLRLKPNKRSFALALYSFPGYPDLEPTREYFRQSADSEAAWLERMADHPPSRPLPPLLVIRSRQAELSKRAEERFNSPLERWRPDPAPLWFDWARHLASGPLRTVLFCQRWRAYETMELARRLDMRVRHLYFDLEDKMCSAQARVWPKALPMGPGPTPWAAAFGRALALARDPKAELFLCPRLNARAIPAEALKAMLEQVRDGKGLLIIKHRSRLESWGFWPKELYARPDPGLAVSVLSAFPWRHIPGYREGEIDLATQEAPLKGYRYGKGRVLVLTIGEHIYHSFHALVPYNEAVEGLEGATDRCLALVARAALVAADREPPCTLQLGKPSADGKSIPIRVTGAAVAMTVRVQDDLDRVLARRTAKLPLVDGRLPLSVPPAGRRCFLDVSLQDRRGRCLDFACALLPQPAGPRLAGLSVRPSTRVHEAAVPSVKLPETGDLSCAVDVKPNEPLLDAVLVWEVRDVFGRVLARRRTSVPTQGGRVSVNMNLAKPVTVCHILDASLVDGGKERAFARQRFTVPTPYPYDDFTVLMWGSRGGTPVQRHARRLCYEMGASMMDLAHTINVTDAGAAREYGIAARSGLRLVPYVAHVGGPLATSRVDARNRRIPCLRDPTFVAKQIARLEIAARQAAPYRPAAFTLGDENTLVDGRDECCHSRWCVAAFRKWLEKKYRTIEALNRAWGTTHGNFTQIKKAMLLTEAARQTVSFAPWIDHRRFMETTFAEAHEQLAQVCRRYAPDAKAGWDGLLTYRWQSGYDFTKLTAKLDLNQTYAKKWLHGELVRSFKRPGALTGKWGNTVADGEAGFSAFPWHCLLSGDNSVWWWMLWRHNYTPFNPDLSVSDFGTWFYQSAAEITSGPGKLLLHAERKHSAIGVLYSQPDMLASAVMGKITPGAPFAGNTKFQRQHTGLLRGILDLGCQYRHISYADVEKGKLPDTELRLLFLSLASCLSDNQTVALRRFVEAGGTLVVDGRAALLTGNGAIRRYRALDAILGVRGIAGRSAVEQRPVAVAANIEGTLEGVRPVRVKLSDAPLMLLEPRLATTTGRALGTVKGTPILIVNKLGRGRAIMLNFPLGSINTSRSKQGPKPMLNLLAAILQSADIEPYCALKTPDGSRPLCVQQVMFREGKLRYLALQQDILLHLPPAAARVELSAPTIVYDMRMGKQIGSGAMTGWNVTLSRKRPLLYALLPYMVTKVTAMAPATARAGRVVPLTASVTVSTEKLGYHVVRLNVFAPGAKRPHRQYSQNISCPGGAGQTVIPFALNDPLGEWRLELRDVATGTKVTRELMLNK